MIIGGTEPLTRPVARSLALIGVGKAIGVGLQTIAFILLAAHLGPDQFGAYAFGLAFSGLFRLIPAFAFEPVLTREIAQQPEREPELVPNLTALRFILGVLSYAALVGTALLVGYRGDNLEAALIAGVVVGLTFTETFRNPLGVRLRFGWTTLADLFDATASVVGVALLVWADASLTAFLWLYVAGKAVHAATLLLVGLRSAPFRWKIRLPLWWPMIRIAAPIAVAGVLMAAYFRIDMAILARLKPAEDVGQYGAAYRFFETFVLVPTLVMGVLQPVLARSFVEAEGVLERRYRRALHLLTLLALPIAVIGTMTAWRIVPLIPGLGDFKGAGVALSILAPGAAFVFVAMMVQSVLISGHLQNRLLRFGVIGLVLNLVLNFVLIPLYSYVGAAVATSITELAVLVLSLRDAHTRLALGWPARLLPTALAGALLVAVLVPAYLLHPFLQLGLGLVAFPIVALATRALTAEDVEGLLPGSRLSRVVPALRARAQSSPE